MSGRVGVVAAVAGEIKPLVAGWERTGPGVFTRVVDGTTVVATASGMGRDAALRGVEAVSRGGELTALASIGWAGGLSCGVKPGVAYQVTEVVDASTGERYRTAAEIAQPLRLVTSARIALRDEKRKLAERYGASLVDMEAAAVARLAEARKLPFYCWKAVTDVASAELPDFNVFVGREGQLQMGRLVAHLLVRPRHWRALVQLQRNGSAGAAALARAIQKGRDEAKLCQQH